MIQIGDLVQSAISGKIGIVVKQHEFDKNYYYVTYRDSTYSNHKASLKTLEKK
tara:strand:- start:106 stop:264 length:159 start_codon:yes stop_codon:yes gene_type:complete